MKVKVIHPTEYPLERILRIYAGKHGSNIEPVIRLNAKKWGLVNRRVGEYYKLQRP